MELGHWKKPHERGICFLCGKSSATTGHGDSICGNVSDALKLEKKQRKAYENSQRNKVKTIDDYH